MHQKRDSSTGRGTFFHARTTDLKGPLQMVATADELDAFMLTALGDLNE